MMVVVGLRRKAAVDGGGWWWACGARQLLVRFGPNQPHLRRRLG